MFKILGFYRLNHTIQIKRDLYFLGNRTYSSKYILSERFLAFLKIKFEYLFVLLLAFSCSDKTGENTPTQDMGNMDLHDALSSFCSPNEKSCKNLVVAETCNAEGSAKTEEECKGNLRCNDKIGECSPEVCTPGAFDGCTAGGLQKYCNPSGTEIVTNVCPGNALCKNGRCEHPECKSGITRCIGVDQLEICNDAGAYVPGAFCPFGTECFNGKCEELCELNKKISSYIGCEYWSADLDNYDNALSQPHAIVVSNISDTLKAEVKLFQGEATRALRFDADGKLFQTTIEPGGAAIYRIPTGSDHSGTRLLSNKAIRIKANIPVIAYQFNPLNNVDVFSNDGTLLLPTNSVGKEYWGMSWTHRGGQATIRGFLTIINSSGAPNRVEITPSAEVVAGQNIPKIAAGETRIFDLNPGDSLNLETSGIELSEAQKSGCLKDSQGPPVSLSPCPDLTGTHIVGAQDLTVFGGHQCANVIQGINRCDHIESILLPVSTWGKNYIGTKYFPRATTATPEPEIWRVVAAEDNTKILTDPPLDGIHGHTIDAGEWRQFEATQDFILGANKPVMLAQYMVGSNWLGIPRICKEGVDAGNPTGIGDPSMTIGVPVDQFRKEYLILTPDAYRLDYINVMVPTGRKVKLDGAIIADDVWKSVGSRGAFEIARLEVSDGFHRLSADVPFGIVSYGYDCHVSYAYPGGLNVEKKNDRP